MRGRAARHAGHRAVGLAARVGIGLAVITLFVLVTRLQRKAARDRDHVHPSR